VPGSIESFVKKLQLEGVDAGKEAAEKIRKEAKNEAEKIIAEANSRAEQIVSKAKKDADTYFSRMQTELEFAVRDAILKLHNTIEQILSAMLTRKIEKYLSNPDYLGTVIRDVIIAYAESDAGKQPFMTFNISDRIDDSIRDDIIKELFQNFNAEREQVAFQNTFSKAGFEYIIDDATVMVTPDSVSEMISEMVSPVLQKLMDRAANKSLKITRDQRSNGPGNDYPVRENI
jgi:vacuolar-type H+-ATPase subunit E/Vma4